MMMAGKFMNYKLDTDTQVFFYEQEFYVLSNFSAFALEWEGRLFSTSEAAYHWEKFPGASQWSLRYSILNARSAHAAFQIAQDFKDQRRPDWNDVKVRIMREILRAKVRQHPYVLQKLMQTGNRELIEDSWRDSEWGWGPNKDGKNLLGKLWMEIREELRAQ